VYDVVVNGKSFKVEVEEVSQNRYRVKVNGKEGIIEIHERTKEIKTERKEELQVSVKEVGEIKAEMSGSVVKVLVNKGDRVRKGEAVLILEAMKMENEILSPAEGKIAKIFVGEGNRVQIGDPLFSLS